ncbi:MAG: hypothetical protein CALGDGBN_03563 [Pseudomonadales bacterium]|nr:hypothetical protein [Pseudomonadales bacterium]
MRFLIRGFAVLVLVSVFVSGASQAGSIIQLADLGCASNQVMRFAAGKWVCSSDPKIYSAILTDSKGRFLAPVLNVRSSAAVVLLPVKDNAGKHRRIKVAARPGEFSWFEEDMGTISFDEPDCGGAGWVSSSWFKVNSSDRQFRTYNDLGIVVEKGSSTPLTASLYTRVSLTSQTVEVYSSAMDGYMSSSCRNNSLPSVVSAVVQYELTVPDILSGISLPLDLKLSADFRPPAP